MDFDKIFFILEIDEDGYPPVSIESLWAEKLDSNSFVIDNIPFFTSQVTLGDIVEVSIIEDELHYVSTKVKSTNSLVRIIFSNGHDPSNLKAKLKDLGCSIEQSHLKTLCAVNIPQDTKFVDVKELLEAGSNQGFWDYEEAILRH